MFCYCAEILVNFVFQYLYNYKHLLGFSIKVTHELFRFHSLRENSLYTDCLASLTFCYSKCLYTLTLTTASRSNHKYLHTGGKEDTVRLSHLSHNSLCAMLCWLCKKCVTNKIKEKIITYQTLFSMKYSLYKYLFITHVFNYPNFTMTKKLIEIVFSWVYAQ